VATTPTDYSAKFDVKQFTERRKKRPAIRKRVKKMKKPALKKKRKALTTQLGKPDANPNVRMQLNAINTRLGRMKLREKHGDDWREKVYGTKERPKYGQQIAKLAKGGIEEGEQTKLNTILQKRQKRRKKFISAANIKKVGKVKPV
jgi:hypothetical protein